MKKTEKAATEEATGAAKFKRAVAKILKEAGADKIGDYAIVVEFPAGYACAAHYKTPFALIGALAVTQRRLMDDAKDDGCEVGVG